MTLHIRSVEAPLDSREATAAAVETLKTMEAMGLLGDQVVEVLSLDAVRSAAGRAAQAGIGEAAAASLRATRLGSREVATALRELNVALAGSPAPAFEWPAMVELFGAERLSALVGVSIASLRRYAAGERSTPDLVAARLHLLVRIVGDLRGAYSPVGVRRWFERVRSQLAGKSPADLLSGDWEPDGDDGKRVLALARSLTGSPAT